MLRTDQLAIFIIISYIKSFTLFRTLATLLVPISNYMTASYLFLTAQFVRGIDARMLIEGRN